MKVIRTAVIVMVLAFSSVLWAQGVSKATLNFPAAKATTLHCSIRQKASSGMWDLTVVAKDSSKHVIFNYLYSVRPTVTKSMNDCHEWMQAVKKKKKAATGGNSQEGTPGQGR